MQKAQNTNDDRILFFDNTRYLLVFLVVAFHSALAYNSHWWPVKDHTSEFFDHVARTLDVFLMPGLFFIAGYFALPSLQKRSSWEFVINKFKRLGIPWLIGVMLMGPIQDFVHYYYVNRGFISLWNSFLTKMKIALTLGTGFIAQKPEFDHFHLWFISLLLTFFIVFALLHKTNGKLGIISLSSKVTEISSNKLILTTILLVSIVSTVLTLIAYAAISRGSTYEPWITIASVIQFQPTRISLYIIFFSLGIYAFHKNWFVNGNIPGHYIFWTILTVALWFGHERLLSILVVNLNPVAAAFYIFTRILFIFSVLLTFFSMGKRFWKSNSKVNRSLAENSYNIYLLHMVFVYLFQLLLLDWLQLSLYLKFIIVSLCAILLSYLFSRFALKPHPKTSIAGMFGLFALLSILASS